MAPLILALAPKPPVLTGIRTLEPAPGDIVGFSGDGWLSAEINCATRGVPWWSLSHVGIVGQHEDRLVLFESTTLDDQPCVIQRKTFHGSQAHEIETRVRSYPGKVWHYPLSRLLFDDERERLNQFLHDTVGIPYDQIGAFRAGDLAGFSLVEAMLHDANLSSLFCSEWCAAAHTTIGIFRTSNPSRWSPNRFVRTERRCGILLRPRRWR